MKIKPVIVLLLVHSALLLLGVLFFQVLRNYSSVEFYAIWYFICRILAMFSIVLALRVSTVDPGFVYTDIIFDKSTKKHSHSNTELQGGRDVSRTAILAQRSNAIAEEVAERLDADESEPSIAENNISNAPREIITFGKREGNGSNIELSQCENNELTLRYCTICKINQPLRAKHCSKCNRCIATYDHHCPFLGVCIGERNRRLFYWYIIVQFFECLLGFYICIDEIDNDKSGNEWLKHNTLNVVLGLLALVFGLFVLSLVSCQTALAWKNLTTFEVLRWTKIYYLWNFEKYQSPFDRGCVRNFSDYCLPFTGERVWPLNKVTLQDNV